MRGSDSNPAGLTGERLGIYQVERLIGSGGMGEVYSERDTRLGRAVAIKVLPPAFTSNASRIARFEREARLLASLNHPHIATVHGLEEFAARGGTERVFGLVMELVDGQTLAERIRQPDASSRAGTCAGLPLDVALDIADQIADALEAAHEQGIVHRDLKPANVSVTTGGSVKVLDFGIAKLENIFRAPDSGAAYFAVAQNGTVVFARGGYERTLVRVDRAGQRTPLLDERRGYRMPAVSPDGRGVAVTIDPRPSQVWVYDITRKSRIPLAIDRQTVSPLWTPDGRRIAYTTDAPFDIYWRTADAGAPAERLLQRDGPQYASSWSSDGKLLIFHEGGPNQYDIWSLPIGGTPRPLIVTPASELGGRLSPDDRWLAYESNESGRFEIYVRPFPNATAGKWMISTSGGQRAVWGPDAKEHFYHVGASMMRVAVDARGPSFKAGNPEPLFSGPYDMTYTGYALTKDGRFILVEIDPHARLTELHAVLNWSEDVTRALARR